LNNKGRSAVEVDLIPATIAEDVEFRCVPTLIQAEHTVLRYRREIAVWGRQNNGIRRIGCTSCQIQLRDIR